MGFGGHGDWIERRKARPQRPAWPTLKRALLLHRAHLGMVGLLLTAIGVAAVAGLAPPLIVQRIIDDAVNPVRGFDGGLLNRLILLMLGFVLLGAITDVAQTYLSNSVGQAVMFDLRRSLYRHLSGMSLRWFTANRTGEVLSRVSNDVGAVQGVVSDTLGGLVGNLITAASTFALMLYLDWRLALFSVAFLPLFMYPAKRVGSIQRDLISESQEELAMMNGQMQETLSVSGALLVKTFGRQADEIERFEEKAMRIRTLNIRRAMVGRGFGVVVGLFGAITPAVVYWYGGHRIIADQASLGTVVASAGLLGRLFSPISQLLNINVTVLSSLALFERLFDYLDLEHEIADKPGAIALGRVHGDVRFEDVSFSYTAEGETLKHVSFEVPRGQLLPRPTGCHLYDRRE